MKLSSQDERLLHRGLDGALSAADRAALDARLLAEPALRAAYQQLQAELRLRQDAGGGRWVGPSPGFTAAVLGAVRRLPARDQLRAAELDRSLVQLCRRLLLAAAAVFAVGLLWQAGAFRGDEPTTLEAAPDAVQREMERLDALIRDGVLQRPPERRTK